MDVKTESPLVCDLTGLTAEQRERRGTWQKDLALAREEVRELPDGYAFRFPAEPELSLKLTEFIMHERRCCPFLTLVLEFEREGGPLWLKATGGEGVKEFLQAELGIGG